MGGHVENSNLLRYGISKNWTNRYYLSNDLLYLNFRINKLAEVLAGVFNNKYFIRRNVLFSHLTLNFSGGRYSVTYYIYDAGYENFFTKVFGRMSPRVLMRFYAKSFFYRVYYRGMFVNEVRTWGSKKYFSGLSKFNYRFSRISKYKFLDEFVHLKDKRFAAFYILICIYVNLAKGFDELYSRRRPYQSVPIQLLVKQNMFIPFTSRYYHYVSTLTIVKVNKFLIGAGLGPCWRRTWKTALNKVYCGYHRRKGARSKESYEKIFRFQDFKHDSNVYFFNLDQTTLTSKLLTRFMVVYLKRKFRLSEILYPMIRMISPFLSGFKIVLAGRYTRAPRASYQIKRFGKVPLNTFCYKIDYSIMHIPLKFGDCSVRIWISRFYGSQNRNSKNFLLGYYLNCYGSLKPYYHKKKIVNVDNFVVSHPFDLF